MKMIADIQIEVRKADGTIEKAGGKSVAHLLVEPLNNIPKKRKIFLNLFPVIKRLLNKLVPNLTRKLDTI